jgi:hypothetical protein
VTAPAQPVMAKFERRINFTGYRIGQQSIGGIAGHGGRAAETGKARCIGSGGGSHSVSAA